MPARRARRRFPSKTTKNKWDASNRCYLCGAADILPPVEGKRNICQLCYLKRMASSTLGKASMWPILLQKLEDQKWRCVYTGVPLELRVNASIDHILPVSRYPKYKHDPRNIEFVDWRINHMKLSMTRLEFTVACKAVAKRNIDDEY